MPSDMDTVSIANRLECITSSLDLADGNMHVQGMTPGGSPCAQDLLQAPPCWEAWEESSWHGRLQLAQQLKLQLIHWQLQLLLKPGLPRRGPWAQWAYFFSDYTGCKGPIDTELKASSSRWASQHTCSRCSSCPCMQDEEMEVSDLWCQLIQGLYLVTARRPCLGSSQRVLIFRDRMKASSSCSSTSPASEVSLSTVWILYVTICESILRRHATGQYLAPCTMYITEVRMQHAG